MQTVPIIYFSDVLCIWAYIAQLRVDAIKAAFAGQVSFDDRFCSVFGDTRRKIATAWGAEDGYARFNAHLRHAAAAFPEVPVNPDIWLAVRPASSMAAHLFLKAAQLAEIAGSSPSGTTEAMMRLTRKAFFAEARDISARAVLREIATRSGADVAAVEALIDDGRAFAALAADYQDADAMRIQGSPSFVLNEGRQKLYGNVGFRIIEANIQELLRAPNPDQASWC